MILPTPSLSSTPPETLAADYIAAYRSISAAIDTIKAIEFNIRDYGDQWEAAKSEMIERLNKLHSVSADLLTVCKAVKQTGVFRSSLIPNKAPATISPR